MLVRWYFKTGFKYERRVNGQCQVIGRLCPVKSLNDRTYCPVFYTSNEPVIIHRRGGGEEAEDLGLHKVKFSRSPFKCYFTDSSDPP